MSNHFSSHKVFFQNSNYLSNIDDNFIDLVVTSPPYPMIEMWDELFFQLNPEIKSTFHSEPKIAFELMHIELDKVWKELVRVTKKGGIICINIGDATRTISKTFQLFSNHSRILHYFINSNFHNLPNILWRKQTNAPNKFMGSGMLPVGAYVTLEHEYILIFRKEDKREFITEETKSLRQESSFFWEERNIWFSDIWENVKGTKQKLKSPLVRERSAAFPFEFAYRLINMFSIKNDTILDPFLGTGTTTIAAIASNRNSIGIELDRNLNEIIESSILTCKDFSNEFIQKRLEQHTKFIQNKMESKASFKHLNKCYSFPVVTSQEVELRFDYIESIEQKDNEYKVLYNKEKQLKSNSLVIKEKESLFV